MNRVTDSVVSSHLEPMINAVVVGASGAIGSALVEQLLDRDAVRHVVALSRSGRCFDSQRVSNGFIDIADENSIAEAAQSARQLSVLNLVIVASGVLRNAGMMPEKSLKTLSSNQFQRVFEVNTFGPALIAKHFLPLMNPKQRCCFAVLSARVGSIADNRLGGWYSYRASKAALNMIIKCASIEMRRTHPHSIVVGLHPGTVDSALSKPFQRGVSPDKLFSPERAARQLLSVIDGLEEADSGKQFAWDGQVIEC